MLQGLLLCALASSLSLNQPEQDATVLYKKVKSSVVVIETNDGAGTGFFVDHGRYVVTAAHVLKNVTSIQLQGTSVRVKGIVHYDESKDIALLSLEKRSKQSLRLQTRTPEPGSRVYVIGTPLGLLDRSISDGIVSAIRPTSRGALIQFTAAVSPGSSGSPLIDSSGRVLGLVLLRLKEGQALNFALSAKDLSAAISSGKATDKKQVQNPYSGGTGEVIGKLGQAITEVPLYAEPSTSSELLYTTQTFQYLVINPCLNERWWAVLLQNGRNAYGEADKIARLPYDVRRNNTEQSTAQTDFSKSGEVRAPYGAQAARAAADAVEWPYKKGGTSLADGCDETSFAWLVYEKIGVTIPRAILDQATFGTPVERLEKLQPGDVLFFWGTVENRIVESAVFREFRNGAAYFVHASAQDGKVIIANLANEQWRSRLIAARRITRP